MTRRLPGILAAVCCGAAALLAGPIPAAQAASCEAGAGVTVVVDFASLGGGVDTRCAAGDPPDGVAALRAAGYQPERAIQERSGYFLCRIDGKPISDPCQRATSSSAYWSYWHAKPGGSWSFSNTGPGTFDPAPGSVEGWAYGAGAPPSVAPPAAAPPQPNPPADQPPPAQPSPAQPPAPIATRVQAAGSTTPAAPRPARSPATRADGASPAVSTSASPEAASATPETTAPAESPSPEPSIPPEPSASPGDPEAAPTSVRDDGSPAGPLAAALLVLALIAAGAWQLAQRRREQL